MKRCYWLWENLISLKKQRSFTHYTFHFRAHFLCQKNSKNHCFYCVFPKKNPSAATTTHPAPPRTVRYTASGLLLRSLRARGNFDKQFGSLLNKVSETQETQNKGLRPTSGVLFCSPRVRARARESYPKHWEMIRPRWHGAGPPGRFLYNDNQKRQEFRS